MTEGLSPQQMSEQQQGQRVQPSPRSIVAAAEIAFHGVAAPVAPVELMDGRVFPGNIIPGSS